MESGAACVRRGCPPRAPGTAARCPESPCQADMRSTNVEACVPKGAVVEAAHKVLEFGGDAKRGQLLVANHLSPQGLSIRVVCRWYAYLGLCLSVNLFVQVVELVFDADDGLVELELMQLLLCACTSVISAPRTMHQNTALQTYLGGLRQLLCNLVGLRCDFGPVFLQLSGNLSSLRCCCLPVDACLHGCRHLFCFLCCILPRRCPGTARHGRVTMVQRTC